MKAIEPFVLLLHILAISFTSVSGQYSAPSRNESQLVCVPFGTCEPCPEDALKEPFCQPFGNRRLMHCTPSPSRQFSDSHGSVPYHSSTSAHSAPEGSTAQSSSFQDDVHVGEIPAWESCGRIVEKERADFYEFVACNLGIALVAIGIVLVRSKQLQAMQARQLAARIGLTRAVPGGWMNG